MGAATFYVREWTPDAATAYRTAVDNARFQSGHGGYSGTIGDSHGFVIIDRDAMSVEAATALAHHLIEAEDERINDKWGPAGAIALTRQTAPGRTITVKAALAGSDIADGLDHQRILDALRGAAKAKARNGESIVHVTRTDLRVTTKVVIDSNTAGAVLKHRVAGKLCDTMSGARKHQRTLLEERAQKLREGDISYDSFRPIDIETVKVAADGRTTLVSGRLEAVRATAVGSARLETRRGAPTDGWLFFGWAPS